MGGVLVLAGVGAGLAWYLLRSDSGTPGGRAAPSALGVARPDATTGSQLSSAASGIAATQLTTQTAAFSDALHSSTAVLGPNLTNVTEELIAQVFKGLSDPTDIILVMDDYSRGGAEQRKIARAFFEYMLKTYPDERLQACGHYMIGALSHWDIFAPSDGVDEQALQDTAQHLEAVLQMPSQRYWYSPALDLLAHTWMVVGGYDSTRRTQAFEQARRYYLTRFDYHEARGEKRVSDHCLIDMFSAMESKFLQAHFDRYKDRVFAAPETRKRFFEKARFYGIETGEPQQ